jgi:hypothetical protein
MKYQKWIDQLGLSMPIKFRPSEHTQISSPLSDMNDREHLLEIDQNAWDSDILISLCQAALAERVDPLFSTYYFEETVSEQSGLIFVQATSPILDIWASDLAFEIEPELMRESTIKLVEAIEPDEDLLDLDMLASIATSLAQVHRYSIKVDLDIVDEMTDDYVIYLASMPKEPSLSDLLDAAIAVCRILGLPEPEMSISESNTAFWKIPVDIVESLKDQ